MLTKKRNLDIYINNFDSNYKDKLEAIMPILISWDYDKLERLFSREHPELKNLFEKILIQYVYFLILCCIFENEYSINVPSKDVDKLWHCHLILNKDYNLLTININGEIITHEPNV